MGSQCHRKEAGWHMMDVDSAPSFPRLRFTFPHNTCDKYLPAAGYHDNSGLSYHDSHSYRDHQHQIVGFIAPAKYCWCERSRDQSIAFQSISPRPATRAFAPQDTHPPRSVTPRGPYPQSPLPSDHKVHEPPQSPRMDMIATLLRPGRS